MGDILLQNLRKLVNLIADQKSISRSNRQADFSYMAQIASEHFIPYIEKCFNHIFQSSSLIDTSALLDSLNELFVKKSNLPTQTQEITE